MYKPKIFSKMLGTSVKTLQRWDNDKRLIAKRTPSGRRFYTHEQYITYAGETLSPQGKTVIYTRVSTRNQKDDLGNQVAFLRQFANASGLIVDEVLEDIGSGLNYNRLKWNKLLKECFEGKVKTIIVAHKDRFIRFGFSWFERFLKEHAVNIIVVNNEALSPEEEMIQDLINIIHVFSCKIYGLRKYKGEIRESLQNRNKPNKCPKN